MEQTCTTVKALKKQCFLKKWSNGTKKNALNAYKNFATLLGLTLPEMPEYKAQSKLPFIPNESELDQLIACAGPKLQPFLKTIKETFARTGEVAALKWQDVDLERHIITINDAEKNSNPRQIEISEKLVTMLKRLPQSGDLVFGENATKKMRQLFHDTKDVVLVKNTLGHKSITSTQIYVKLLQTSNREEYV